MIDKILRWLAAEFARLRNVPGNKVPAVVHFFPPPHPILEPRRFLFHAANIGGRAAYSCFLQPSLFLTRCGTSSATLVTVWGLDFLLNSPSKETSHPERSDSLFPPFTYPPGIAAGGPDCASPATTVLRLGKIPLNSRGIRVRPTDREIHP